MDNIVSTAIVGSFLDPAGATRYSDIDLVIIVDGDPDAPNWDETAARLRKNLPALSLHTEAAGGLARRAQMLACRLLCKGLLLAGLPAADFTSWPDPVRHAWIARKFAADALRYGYAAARERATSVSAFMFLARRDVSIDENILSTLEEMHMAAGELAPPPDNPTRPADWYRAAICIIIDIQNELLKG